MSSQDRIFLMDSGRRMGIFVLFLFFTAAASDLKADGSALLALRSGVGSLVLPTWNASTSPCSWQGVSCESGRVTALRLPGSGLIGQIPAESVGNLTALRTLSLRFNAIDGSLPSDFANAVELRNLYLQQNRFAGEFPAVLLSLKNLVRLNLAGNNFTGGIGAGLGNLTRLRTLFLESNNFSGTIPDVTLPNLEQFNVSFNSLNGSIPPAFRKMPANAFLGISVCGGPLPACPGDIAPSPAVPGPAPSPGGTGTGTDSGGGSTSGGNGKKLSGGAIAGIVVGSAVALMVLLIIIILLYRKNLDGARKEGVAAPTAVRTTVPPASASAAVAAMPRELAMPREKTVAENAKKLVFFSGDGKGEFDLEDLLRASAEVLGKGTYGTAYKAVLEIGMAVAVKRLKDVSLEEREFKEKIEEVGFMDHQNLVPLKAYYFSKDEKLLVYDYMQNGSLSALLHGNRGSGRTPINWETRSAIALAAARGIAYIHSRSPSTSHGNIKSSNILLGKSNEDARVSDHGLAHIVGAAAPSMPARAAGYRAPEVTDPRRISQKADVYSFGVLLLELLTGKSPAQALLNEEGVDLPRWVQSVVREDWTSEVFDLELIRNQNVEEEMVQLLQLAIDCAAQYPDNRPSMPEVVGRIEEIRRSSLQGAREDSTGNGGNESSRTNESIDGTRPRGDE